MFLCKFTFRKTLEALHFGLTLESLLLSPFGLHVFVELRHGGGVRGDQLVCLHLALG